MKYVLVTGGAGFIGSNFIDFVLSHDDDVMIINYDLLTYAGHLENLTGVANHSGYHFLQGDIADMDAVLKVFEAYPIDWVVNFAAETHVDNSIDGPGVFVKTNVVGTQVLLQAAKEHWQTGIDDDGYPVYRDGVKYLQVSTDEVYGTLGAEGLFTEETPISPNSPYSSSKAGADMLVRAYSETYHLPVNITRCSNNYGPKQFPEKLIPLMIHNALNDKSLPVYGDGMQIRDWLHVKDHCSAIYTVLGQGVEGRVYNIGGLNEKANIEIVRTILKAVDKPESLITFVQDRLGHDRRYAIDNSRIQEELGWKPNYTFEKGIAETIQWYTENEEWHLQVTGH